MVLNPEVRKLIIAAWEWKSTLVTPFDEHEAIEIEEEKVYLKIKLTVYSYQSTLSNVYIWHQQVKIVPKKNANHGY